MESVILVLVQLMRFVLMLVAQYDVSCLVLVARLGFMDSKDTTRPYLWARDILLSRLGTDHVGKADQQRLS
jgi:hypothetical protein